MANSLGEIRQPFFTKLCTPDGAREKATRLCQTAGRRSAGLGSNGGTQAHTHAVGVRAHGSVRIPQKGGGDMTDGAICSASVHWWFLTGRK